MTVCVMQCSCTVHVFIRTKLCCNEILKLVIVYQLFLSVPEEGWPKKVPNLFFVN